MDGGAWWAVVYAGKQFSLQPLTWTHYITHHLPSTSRATPLTKDPVLSLLQYYCLENPVDRGAWWATVFGVAKSRT